MNKFWKVIDDISLFLREARNRFNASTPKFLRVVGNICAFLAGLAFIPTSLAELGIILPPEWVSNLTKIITVSGLIGKLITKFTFSKGERIELPYTESKQEEEKVKNNNDEKNN